MGGGVFLYPGWVIIMLRAAFWTTLLTLLALLAKVAFKALWG
jgi:hypothetical protein